VGTLRLGAGTGATAFAFAGAAADDVPRVSSSSKIGHPASPQWPAATGGPISVNPQPADTRVTSTKVFKGQLAGRWGRTGERSPPRTPASGTMEPVWPRSRGRTEAEQHNVGPSTQIGVAKISAAQSPIGPIHETDRDEESSATPTTWAAAARAQHRDAAGGGTTGNHGADLRADERTRSESRWAAPAVAPS